MPEDLDLTGDGTLSVTVNGHPSVVAFSDMLSAFQVYNTQVCVPAVSLASPGRVRFLGFEE
jgi:hypothetical protein